MRVFVELLRTLLVGVLGIVFRWRVPEVIVVKTLFGTQDHPVNERFFLRSSAASFLRVIRIVWGNSERDDESPEQVDSVIVRSPVTPATRDYLCEYVDLGNVAFVERLNAINQLSLVGRFLITVLAIFWFLMAFPAACWTGSIGPLQRVEEAVRTLKVVCFVSELKPSRVIYYGSYERNGNLVAFMLKRVAQARVTRIVSPNPIVFHYQRSVCDDFILTSPSQILEFLEFRKDWFVNRVFLWKPPQHLSFPENAYRIAEGDGLTIGVLSGGQWRRKERGDAFNDVRLKQLHAEERLHDAVRRFLDGKPELKITVYPHPSEKFEPKVFARAKELYQERLGKERLSIVGPDERTHQRFRDADVFVSVWSTSALEAIYCGHKVLFAQFGCEKNAPGSSLEGVQATDERQFQERLGELLSMSADEYFQKYNLMAYRHDFYPTGPIKIFENGTVESGVEALF